MTSRGLIFWKKAIMKWSPNFINQWIHQTPDQNKKSKETKLNPICAHCLGRSGLKRERIWLSGSQKCVTHFMPNEINHQCDLSRRSNLLHMTTNRMKILAELEYTNRYWVNPPQRTIKWVKDDSSCTVKMMSTSRAGNASSRSPKFNVNVSIWLQGKPNMPVHMHTLPQWKSSVCVCVWMLNVAGIATARWGMLSNASGVYRWISALCFSLALVFSPCTQVHL